MPYFEQKAPEDYTRQFGPVSEEEEDWEEESYEDGFDDLTEDPEENQVPELSEEEKRLASQRSFRIAATAGNVAAVLAGIAAIFVLVVFLIRMIQFVSSDFNRTFALWLTRF